jgi:CRISPR/Cas system type I-B associated protein Csh2 (Cas7 group RAMP superfamily)
MRQKTNIEREARKQRNKAKRGIKNVKKDVFSAIRGIVNAQTKLDEWAKDEGLTEEDLEKLKKGEVDASSEEEKSNG